MNIQMTIRSLAIAITVASLLGLPAFGGPLKNVNKPRVEFYLHSVKCVKETNHNSIWGSDEIYLGGEAVGLDKRAHKIPVFKVHGDFDKGEVKTYKPPLLLHTFDAVNNKSGLNPGYNVSLVLVEKDHGGLAKFFDQYDDKLKAKLKESAVENGDPVLIALSELAGPVFNQIKKLLGDDPFRPRNLSLRVSTTKFKGSGNLDVKTLNIKGNGGAHYIATYEWRIVN